MAVVLSVDLGGTSLRAALVAADGAPLGEAAVPAPVVRDRQGRSEIAPEDWWAGLLQACAMLAAGHPREFAATSAVAICGATRTQIFLGRDGAVLRPAMTWRDSRAEADLAAMAGDLAGLDHPELAALNPYHPAARLLWLARHEPAAFAALAAVLDPKDYLNWRLTGVAASDRLSLQRLAAADRPQGGRSLLAILGLDGAAIPPLLAPQTVVGEVLRGLPAPLDRLAGCPVAAGAPDTFAAVLGLGALKPGLAYNISGTTDVFGMIGGHPARAEGLVAVDWGDGHHHLGGPSEAGAGTVHWLLSVLASGEAGIGDRLARLDRTARHAQPLLLLPFLQGERTPFWDPDLRGALLGTGRDHGGDDMLWAALEGVACLNAVILDRAEAAFGLRAGEVRFGGGAARSAVWAQVKADILDRPVRVGAAAEPGLVGAAILGLTATGRFASVAEGQEALVRTAAVYAPDPTRAAAYAELKALFVDAHVALAPLMHRLARLRMPV